LLGQDPFVPSRQLPVLAVIGDDVYLPVHQFLAKRRAALGNQIAINVGAVRSDLLS
jgi:hypothetical protein